jgi:CRISPR-associated endonuclease Csn1
LITGKTYAVRKELSADNFKTVKNIEEIASIRIRNDMFDIYHKFENDKKSYEQAIERYKQNSNENPYHRLKKVRIHSQKDMLIPIKDQQGKPYRHVIGGNNFCAEIWCPTKGKKAGKWQCEVIQAYYANQKDFIPQWRQDNPTAYKVMRLQINDMLAIDKDNHRTICRIQKMNAKGMIVLRQHNDASNIEKIQINTTASSLQKYNARKIFVSPIGKIYDPGKAKGVK